MTDPVPLPPAPHPVDVAAEALLVAVLERQGGDLRAAFALLCTQVTIEDVTGEDYAAALGRAVACMVGRTRFGPWTGAEGEPTRSAHPTS